MLMHFQGFLRWESGSGVMNFAFLFSFFFFNR